MKSHSLVSCVKSTVFFLSVFFSFNSLRADQETVIKNDTDAWVAIDSASLRADAKVPVGETRWLKLGSGVTNEKWILKGSGSKQGSISITNGYTQYITCIIGASENIVVANPSIEMMPILKAQETLTIITPAANWEIQLRVATVPEKIADAVIEGLADALKNNSRGMVAWLENYVREYKGNPSIKEWVGVKGTSGITRLMRAIQDNNMARVRFFVAAGGDINARTDQDYLMVLFGRDMVAEGSSVGLNWNMTSSHSLPNYEEAKKMSQFASASMGVGSEGNESHIFTGGKTALGWAKFFERTDMYNFLKEHGAVE